MPNSKGKKTEKKPSFLRNTWQDPQGRAIVWLGFYFVLFLAIILFFRSSVTKSDHVSSSFLREDYQWELLEDKNYEFKATQTIHSHASFFDGKQYQEKRQLTFHDHDQERVYYNFDQTFFAETDGHSWNMVDSPFPYPKLLSLSVLRDCVRQASFYAKSQFHNRDTAYTYQISTTTLYELLEKQTVDLADEVNTITLRANAKRQVYQVIWDMTPYHQAHVGKEERYRLEITYDRFGRVRHFELPL